MDTFKLCWKFLMSLLYGHLHDQNLFLNVNICNYMQYIAVYDAFTVKSHLELHGIIQF